MHRRILTGTAALAVGAIAIAACGSANGASSDAHPRAVHQMSGAPDRSVSTPATIHLASNATIGQQVLVDATGKTIYLFVPDGTATQSTVPAQFKPNWPPVTSMATPNAGSGLDDTKIGVQTQSDGTRQVTYNGHLLYTFVNDTAPGDAKGQGQGPNNWFVLDAAGNAIGAPAPKPTLMTAQNPTLGQPILVDGNGMSLYLFVPDGTATQSTVPAQFKPNWPPLTATSTPLAGPGLDATKLGVQTQSDGTRQVTYNGHLLYTFVNDRAPGDVNGQGQGPNNWFVLSTSGDAFHPASSAPASAARSQMGW